MTEGHDAAAIRRWIVDYVVEHLDVDRSAVDTAAPLIDLGVGSKDAVVLAGELSEFTGRSLSPVDLWEHPTIELLASHLGDDAREATAESLPADPGPVHGDPVVIVGAGCRLPGGIDDPEGLWDLLESGGSAVGEVPADRWAPWYGTSAAADDVLARTTRHGGFLDDVAGFDAEFFDIAAREAAGMDPQQRILLEVAWEALERAGIAPESLRRSKTGVFVGACVSEYGYLAASDLSEIDAWSNTGGALSIIANRLSYLLDLRGPSLTIDTACSSSLVALHLAAQSLRLGECDTALVGGVNLLLSPAVFHGFDESGALSPTGRCSAFDAAADGFVRGEGCGVVVLKRLSDAQRDGDDILAVVRGSAVNQDGRSNGLFAPNPAAQMAVLRSAYEAAGVSPREVDYVEAHGTGTPLGDPIEARALGSVLGRGRRPEAPLLIGSVKGNVGHLEGAAGITGLIKTVLALRKGELPQSPHYSEPNPHIPFGQLGIAVVDQRRAWPELDRPRRAGVSSFGFGGTNAHVVLEQAPDLAPAADPGDSVVTLVLSAKNPQRLAGWADRLAEWLDGASPELRLGAVAAGLDRRPLRDVAAAVVARDVAGAVGGLRALAAGEPHPSLAPSFGGKRGTGTVFVFSGQGSQWAGMARRLLAEDPAFAAAVDELEPDFLAHAGFSLRAVIEDEVVLTGDAQVQPALVGVQVALAHAWRAHGVEPDAVIGHSVGEVSAAVVAGALTPAEGLRVVSTRARLMAELGGTGAVALLGAAPDRVAELIAPYTGVEIAVLASPRQTGVAGPTSAVESVIAAAAERNVFARRVDMEVASHTALTEPILGRLGEELADLVPATPRIPFHSTVFDTSSPAVDGGYWVANLRNRVELQRAVASAAAQHSTFIEVSPHAVLAHAMTETLSPEHRVLGTLARHEDDTVAFRRALATVRGPGRAAGERTGPAAAVLPTAPWQRTAHWLSGAGRSRRAATPTVRTFDDAVPQDWQYRLDWVPAPGTPPPTPSTGTWVVAGDGTAAAELATALAPGTAVIPLAPFTSEQAPDDAALAAILAADHVVYAPDPVPDPFDPCAGYALFGAGRRLLTALIAGEGGSLHLVTRSAQALREGDRSDPAHAVLWGLGRTLALEHPRMFGGLIDVDPSVPAPVLADYLRSEAGATDREDQVVYRAGVRHVPRLSAGLAPSEPPAAGGSARIDTGGAHLVVGATGNLGPTLIRELVRSGVRTVVAVSRDPRGRLDELTAELAGAGAEVVVIAADAADEQSMAQVFRRFGSDLPPLAGIHLAAFGGGPVTLAQMTDSHVEAMFAPKLDAVAVLHRLSLTTQVKHFVLFTSISGLTGSRWLGHYAATTTYLDAFAYARRAAGLPATAINWGLWQSLHASQDATIQETTTGSGLIPMDDGTAIRALEGAITRGAARSVVTAADWPRLAAAYRVRAALTIVDELAATHDDGSVATDLRVRLREAPFDQRAEIIADAVAAIVAAALGLESVDLLDSGAGFFQAGMDSLTVVTVARTLSQELGEELPTSVVFDYPSADALTGYLRSMLPELVDDDEPDADDYDDFTEDELLAQLAERLN
ncbi:SDR family NAD(P)-dependent oxidoreductase [Tsukamurella asaccharolytica]|uniref:SDR family NAD(P)-dependent oxidoreductase n=1 Tax=Tsukamurella asaccharolytica TaxID=2592067 RepID=A0A5C5R9Y4_9ACTN|nr:type I polyketide synthase [Tsukamurella asaccharolytica]TWS19919.1 SDR family NAD(P)-dependent oxidoreductase [Tsukamurella asaccharolytica]